MPPTAPTRWPRTCSIPSPTRPPRLPPPEPRHDRLRHHPRPGLRPHSPTGLDVPPVADGPRATGPDPDTADGGTGRGGGGAVARVWTTPVRDVPGPVLARLQAGWGLVAQFPAPLG